MNSVLITMSLYNGCNKMVYKMNMEATIALECPSSLLNITNLTLFCLDICSVTHHIKERNVMKKKNHNRSKAQLSKIGVLFL